MYPNPTEEEHVASTMNSRVRPAARLRWTFISLWEPIKDYLVYPMVQWCLIVFITVYSVTIFRILNRMKIRGQKYLHLNQSGDLVASWHESMCDSFAIGAAIGPSMIWRQNAIPWNFAAARNFMSRRLVKTIVTMLKTHPVKESESGKRADSSALRTAIALLKHTNVELFPAGTRYRPDQIEDPVAPAGFGLTVLMARRVIPVAFVGMGGHNGVQPYRKTEYDGPPTVFHIFGPYPDWVMGVRFGKRIVMNVGEPIDVEELKQRFAGRPNDKQLIADFVMQRIIELRREIL